MPSKTSQRIVGSHALLALLLHRRCNFALDDPASSLLPDALSMCHGGAGYTLQKITRDSKIEARSRRNPLSEAPESFLGAQKSSRDRSWRVWRRPRVSKSAKRAPKIAKVGSSWSQVGLQKVRVGTEGAQVGAKLVPRAPKLGQKAFNTRPRRVQEAPS